MFLQLTLNNTRTLGKRSVQLRQPEIYPEFDSRFLDADNLLGF